MQQVRNILYLAIVVAATICFTQWRRLNRADRWIGLLLAATIVEEIVAYWLALRYHNNLASYHFYGPVELCLTSMYLCDATAFLRHRKVGLWLCAVAVVAGFLLTRYVQPLGTMNSLFLLLESTSIILLCMLSFYAVLVEEDAAPLKQTQFWFTLILIFYWSMTFWGWGLQHAFTASLSPSLNHVFVNILALANLIFYTGIGCVFLFYRKLARSGE